MPLNARRPSARSAAVEPDLAADRDRRQRVAHVVHAEQRRRERAERLARGDARRSASGHRRMSMSVACQSAPSPSAERLDRD